MRRLWKMGLAVVAVLAFAGAAVGFVAAQTDGEVPVPGKERLSRFISRLADNLGIEQEELEAAIDQTQLDLVDEAVADGKLTDEQADRMRERIESGDAPLFPKPPHRPHHRGANVVAQVAELLEVEPEVVVEGLKDGQSLAQIAEANDVTADELSAFLMGELEARLAEAVENEKIDQARADEILANAPDQIEQLINREGLPGKRTPHRGGGFFPGGFRQGGFVPFAPEGGETPVEPDVTTA